MIVVDNKKLEKMNKACQEIARKELILLKKENDSFSSEKIDQMVDEYKEELAVKYSNEINKIQREFNRNVFDFKQKQRMRVNDFKQSLKDDLVIQITKEIEKFTDSYQYEEYLINNIKNVLKNINDVSKCVIYITEKDYNKFYEKLTFEFNLKLEKMDNKNLGGCIVVDKIAKVSLDNTIKNNIEEKVQNIKF